MLAWKQPPFKECVIAHWSSDSAPKMKRGSSVTPKPRLAREFDIRDSRFERKRPRNNRKTNIELRAGVGEHCHYEEAELKGEVER